MPVGMYGVAAALGAVVLWATNAFAATIALDRLSVLQLLTVQYGSAACLVLAWRGAVEVRQRRTWRRAPRGPRSRFVATTLATGVFGLTGTIFLQYSAFATAPIVGANIIAYGWPLMAAVWVAVTVRSPRALAGVGFAVLGLLGVAAIFTGQHTGPGGVQVGYLLALGSAACMAFYTVAAGRIAASVVDLLLPATVIGALVAGVGSLLHGPPWPPIGQWWPAVYIGVGPMAAGYGLWTLAMAGRRAERLAPIGYATPLLSTLLLLAAGQPFTRQTLLGAVLILACSTGVLVNERRAHRTPNPATARAGHHKNAASVVQTGGNTTMNTPTTLVKRGTTRTKLLGYDTCWKVSELGVAQRRHDYPPELLATILSKALALKNAESERQHLNLRLITKAHTVIPEINELVHWPGRLETLSELASTRLEPYPVAVIASTITFMGTDAGDGVVDWHADGVPVTEIIPLDISADAIGGDLLVYHGNYEQGQARLRRGETLPDEQLLRFPHRLGHSTLAQLMRVLHSTQPMHRGQRISLNLNLRSAVHPYIDDDAMYYLGADNPSFDWVEQYLDDVKHRQLPAYKKTQE